MLTSTAIDYLRFQQMILNGGELDGVRILDQKTVELMLKNHIGDLTTWPNAKGEGYGLGFGIVKDPDSASTPQSKGTVYWAGAHTTFFWIDPKEELIAIFMTQLLPNRKLDIELQFKKLVYQAIVE